MWTRKKLRQFIKDIDFEFPFQPQMTVALPDGTEVECYQTYANRLFAVKRVSDGRIAQVYYGLGWNNEEPRLAKLGYRTKRFKKNGIDYLEIFEKVLE
jgi:hypothetical protein